MRHWDDLLAAIDLPGLQVITYDMRGHGDSEKAGSVTYDSLAGDAVAVADGASRFVVVGFRMSAKSAQYVTSAHPDRVLAQILIAGCAACAIPLPQEIRRDCGDHLGIRGWTRRFGRVTSRGLSFSVASAGGARMSARFDHARLDSQRADNCR